MKKIKRFLFRGIHQNLLLVILGFIVGGFLVNGAIAAWEEPSCGPAGCNVAQPINVSSDFQTKAGGLGLEGDLEMNNNNVCLSDACRNTWPQEGMDCVLKEYNDDGDDDKCPAGYKTWGGAYTKPTGEMMCCQVSDTLGEDEGD